MLAAMLAIIVGDVALRNLAVPGPAARPGVEQRDLRVDALPDHACASRRGCCARASTSASTSCCRRSRRKLAWLFEWLGDLIGLACCVVLAAFAAQAAWSSYRSGAVNIKTLVTPEWWWLAPLPLVFVLLSIEMVFRMVRLARAERAPRSDAVSAA